MTYANAQKTRICLPSLGNFDLLYPEDIAVGEESYALKEVFKSSVEHYFAPTQLNGQTL